MVTCETRVVSRTLASTLWFLLSSDLLSKANTVFQILPICKHFTTILEQVSDSNNFQICWFYVVIVQAKCGNLVMLVNRLVRHFAKVLNTLPSVTFHVVAPRSDVFRIFFSFLTSVLVLISFENNFCCSITMPLLTCAARWVHPRLS